MKKAQDGHEDFHNILMIYHSVPLQNGLSPAQLLMGLCTNLPVMEELLTPTGAHKVKANKERKRKTEKNNNNVTKG